MLRSIDSCQNRVSADQYHLTVPRAKVSTHRGRVFFEVIRWQITSFKWSQVQVYFFQWFIRNMLCLCHYGSAILRFWFQTDLGRENSDMFVKIQVGKTFSHHGHALVTLYVQFLNSDWSKVDRWVHAQGTQNHNSLLEAEETIFDILEFIRGSEAWGNKTKEMSLKMISFVLFPQASQPRMNFNISELVYYKDLYGNLS